MLVPYLSNRDQPGLLDGMVMRPRVLTEAEEVEIGDITVTELTAGNTTTDATSFNTAVITPAANTPIYVWVCNTRATPTLPTISGNGITWAQIETVTYASSRRQTLFVGINAAPSEDEITIDFGGLSQGFCAWSVVQCAGAATSDYTVQVDSAGYDTSDTSTVGPTLAALSHAKNVHIAWASAAAASGVTPDADFTLLSTPAVVTTPTSAPTSGYALAQTNYTMTHASVSGRACISVEVKAGEV
jgi:hypothetical protein